MNKKVYELLNDQINKELYSAYLYLDISNYYSDQGLDGFASWYRIQAAEEEEHAMKIYDYLLDNGQKVVLKAIDAPDEKFKDLSAPIDKAAEHEAEREAYLDDLADKANEMTAKLAEADKAAGEAIKGMAADHEALGEAIDSAVDEASAAFVAETKKIYPAE